MHSSSLRTIHHIVFREYVFNDEEDRGLHSVWKWGFLFHHEVWVGEVSVPNSEAIYSRLVFTRGIDGVSPRTFCSFYFIEFGIHFVDICSPIGGVGVYPFWWQNMIQWWASLAVSSTRSLPPGIHKYHIFLSEDFAVKWVFWIFLQVMSEEFRWFCRAVSIDCELLCIVKLMRSIFDNMYSMALIIIRASFVYM